MGDTNRKDIITVDLTKPLRRETCGVLLAVGDEYANRFGAVLVNKGVAVNVSGYTVTGAFIRPDGATVTVTGGVDGGIVYVDLPSSCYVVDGPFTLSLKVVGDGFTQTVRMVDGYIRRTASDSFVADDETVFTIDQMKGLAADMKTTNEEATALITELNTAADEVADKLPYIGENGNWWQWDDEAGAFVDSGSPSRGETGQRGTGILVVTTIGSTYTTEIGGYTPQGRKALSAVLEEAGVSEVLVGDVIQFSHYQYTVGYVDSSYVYFGNRKSIRGATGADGTSVTVQSVSESTADGGSNVVTFSDGTSITIKNGSTGKDGTGVTILGSYDSESALKAAHPTGNPGDAYLIDGYLYVWSASGNAWQNVGKIQGPQGEPGVAGSDGKDGADGKTPVKGTDYWTAADRQSMVNDVIAALPVYGGEVESV